MLLREDGWMDDGQTGSVVDKWSDCVNGGLLGYIDEREWGRM